MARHRNRREKETNIKLRQPDRSGPDPTQQTLLDLAEERGLWKAQHTAMSGDVTGESYKEPLIGRMGESVFWSLSLTMLHFTLDVLVAHQYAVAVKWSELVKKTLQAFPIILLLFYSFHPHPSPSVLLPALPKSIQPILHQIFFFASSISAGCYLIYITNTYGYYAVMKQSPPLGCLWIWSVIELNLGWASGSLLVCIAFLKSGGYNYL